MGKQRICLIYTGGTIAMRRTADGLVPPTNPKDFLRIAPELKDIVDVHFVPLLNKDSTNMNPQDWQKMARAVYNRRNAGYRGFVIAHGTDTMHFSASALSFALGPSLNFPVVFTGAQTIPEVPHGDARVNLVRACLTALTELAEVVVCFGDYIFRGCRVQKKDERKFDAFESPGYFPIGYISEVIELHPSAKLRRPGAPSLQKAEFRPDFESRILQVSLIPGLDPRLLRPAIDSDLCRGVMLQSFGWGNVPDEEPYSFESTIRFAVEERGKPVVIVSQFPARATIGTAYKPGLTAVRAGAIATGNMTNAAAVAKFGWILSQVEKEKSALRLHDSEVMESIRKRMQDNYVGETDVSPAPQGASSGGEAGE